MSFLQARSVRFNNVLAVPPAPAVTTNSRRGSFLPFFAAFLIALIWTPR